MNEVHEPLENILRELLTPFYRDRGWTLGSIRFPRMAQQRPPDFVVLGYDEARRPTLFAWWCQPVRDAREVAFLGDLVRRWQPVWTPDLPGYERVVALLARPSWPEAWLHTARQAGVHPVTLFDLDVDALQQAVRARTRGVPS